MSSNNITVESSAKQTATVPSDVGYKLVTNSLRNKTSIIKTCLTLCGPSLPSCGIGCMPGAMPNAFVRPLHYGHSDLPPKGYGSTKLEMSELSLPGVDEEGIKRATTLIHQLIAKEEQSGIAANRIVLGGFSQGGALALYAGLTYPRPLAGILAFSCWLPKHDHVVPNIAHNKHVPVLQCHGDSDPVVQTRWGQLTADVLSKALTKHQFKTYRGMGHSSCNEEQNDAKTFIANCLSN
ncbi:unnamed protein product [Oppiella nova]|uniref:palmitoyl-protein hydrolase n=1 Tax=Oppiella nova TaxID=334625 RepID=A0A7R9LJ41_9ACAR|nr:unnamed protein product [Oppiella nova]CAG2164114.1 unnamed protein product [Oppiella nova]